MSLHVNQKIRHANPRVYVGPETKEITISLSRSFGVNADLDSVTIDFKRKKVGAEVISTWSSYDVTNDKAHFEIPEEFRTNIIDFPRGFYDGSVFFGECIIGDIELIKAPGHYFKSSESIEHKCVEDNTWVEPDCADEEESVITCGCNCNGDPDEPCDCIHQVKNNCPTCFNEVFVATMDVKEDYLDEDECEV